MTASSGYFSHELTSYHHIQARISPSSLFKYWVDSIAYVRTVTELLDVIIRAIRIFPVSPMEITVFSTARFPLRNEGNLPFSLHGWKKKWCKVHCVDL